MCAIIGAELNEGLGVYQGGRTIDAQHLAKLVIINNNLWAVAVGSIKVLRPIGLFQRNECERIDVNETTRTRSVLLLKFLLKYC